MSRVLTDLSGVPIPPDHLPAATGAPRVIAVPPIRDRPSEQTLELKLSLQASPLTHGGGWTTLVDVNQSAGTPYTGFPLNSNQKARIDGVTIVVTDMVLTATPAIFIRVLVNQQPVTGWTSLAIFPASGRVSVAFPAEIDVQPGADFVVQANNVDTVDHALFAYVNGWTWDKSLVQS